MSQDSRLACPRCGSRELILSLKVEVPARLADGRVEVYPVNLNEADWTWGSVVRVECACCGLDVTGMVKGRAELVYT